MKCGSDDNGQTKPAWMSQRRVPQIQGVFQSLPLSGTGGLSGGCDYTFKATSYGQCAAATPASLSARC